MKICHTKVSRHENFQIYGTLFIDHRTIISLCYFCEVLHNVDWIFLIQQVHALVPVDIYNN